MTPPADPYESSDPSGLVTLRTIGRGASGVVELVRDGDGRILALKRLAGRWDHPAAAARFRREARILARLSHPNIVRSAGGLASGGHAWIVMEHVDGASLHELLRTGPLPAADALAVIEALSQALTHAHGLGVVHRDLTPSNVLISPEGVAKLADFGVATMVGADRNISLITFRTAPGTLVGTPTYLSPEAADGTVPITPRSDVYSLGVLAYQLLAGRLPYDTGPDLLSALQAHLYGEPIHPGQVPGAVAAVLLQALEKAPERRPATAARFWCQLEETAGSAWPQWRQHTALDAAVRRFRESTDRTANDANEDGAPADSELTAATISAPPPTGDPWEPLVSTVIAPCVYEPRRARRWLHHLAQLWPR
jgi:serine/threonine protein kinase